MQWGMPTSIVLFRLLEDIQMIYSISSSFILTLFCFNDLLLCIRFSGTSGALDRRRDLLHCLNYPWFSLQECATMLMLFNLLKRSLVNIRLDKTAWTLDVMPIKL